MDTPTARTTLVTFALLGLAARALVGTNPEPPRAVTFEDAPTFEPKLMASRRHQKDYCPDCGTYLPSVDGHRAHLTTPFWEAVAVKTRWNPPIQGIGFDEREYDSPDDVAALWRDEGVSG